VFDLSSEEGHPCLVLILREKASDFSLLCMVFSCRVLVCLFTALRIKPRDSGMLDKCCATDFTSPYPQPGFRL
jgi:hypothetical protein